MSTTTLKEKPKKLDREERLKRVARIKTQVREADERLKRAERLTADHLAARVNVTV